MTNPVKMLSDDEVASIATRKAFQYGTMVSMTVAERDALCATVRALRAENEQLKEELFEHQPINQNKTTESGNKKQAERIAARFTEKFCRAAPLAATGEFRTGLAASIQSALNSANTALREQLAQTEAARDQFALATATYVEAAANVEKGGGDG